MKHLYMETTRIPAAQTAATISVLLGGAGATAILQEYGPNRQITALSFRLLINGREIPFRLPVRTAPIFEILSGRRKIGRLRHADDDRDQAARVAWRLALRWVEAQLAYVETGTIAAEEAFLAYVQVSATETIYQRLVAVNFDAARMLPAPE